MLVNLGVLIELRETLVEPDREKLRMPHHVMRVLVVHGGVRVFLRDVEAQKDVTLVVTAQK